MEAKITARHLTFDLYTCKPVEQDPVGHLRGVRGGGGSAGRRHRQLTILLVAVYDNLLPRAVRTDLGGARNVL